MKKIALAVFSLLVFVVVLDLVSAWIYKRATGHSWGLSQPEIEKRYRTRVDPYHHGLKPFSSVRAEWGARKAWVHVNSLGFRDSASHEVSLDSEEKRILFIGDSFTEGIGVDYEDTFVGLIEKALRPRGVSVLNAAVASYSPIIYWKKLEYLIETVGLDIDEVVVFLDISDANDDAEEYWIGDDGNVEGVTPPPEAEKRNPSGIRKMIAEHTMILQSMLSRRAECDPADAKDDESKITWRGSWTVVPEAYRKYGVKGLAYMDLYMTHLRVLLRRHHIPLTLVVYPWPDQIRAGDCDSVQVAYWRDWTSRKGVRFINLFPEFVRGATRGEREQVIKLNYIDGDVHWNEVGHQKVADAVLRAVMDDEEFDEPPCDPDLDRIDLHPDAKKQAWAEYHLADEFRKSGLLDDAEFHYRRALDYDPESASVLNDLARFLLFLSDATSLNAEEAVQLAQRAVCVSHGEIPEVLDTLAMAQAELGQKDRAHETASKAYELALKQGNKALAEALRRRIWY